MTIDAVEVFGATPQDLVLRSILDNVNRLSLSQTERIRAAKTLHDSGVKPERAANAFGISLKTYQRDLLIAENKWMLDLIYRNAVTPSDASRLLEVATKEGCVPELDKYLASWVAKTQKEIAKRSETKKLSPAEQLVKTSMKKNLIDHWIDQMRKKEPLDTIVPVGPEIAIDAEANKVSFKAAEIDMVSTPLPELAKFVGEIESAKQVMMQYLKARHAVESAMGPQDLARQVSKQSGGLDYLRQEGLSDLADDLELQRLEEAELDQQSPGDSEEDTTEDK